MKGNLMSSTTLKSYTRCPQAKAIAVDRLTQMINLNKSNPNQSDEIKASTRILEEKLAILEAAV